MRSSFNRLGWAFLIMASVGLSAHAACPVTDPPNPAFVPPPPYDDLRTEDGFWYGTNMLWTHLGDGIWHLNGNSDKHGGYVTKLVFWAQGFNWRKEPEPELVVTGRRLDGGAPVVTEAHANAVFVPGKTPAIMTGIRIPTVGCWEVTGYYRGYRLSFVVSVEP